MTRGSTACISIRRRQDFRRAREALLNARGWPTLAGENQAEEKCSPSHPTIIEAPESPADPGNFWLRDGEAIYPLRIGLNTIGRSSDNDVVVEGSYVSRRHCVILVHSNSDCELHDTASKNGTYLNGQRLVGPTRLACGDEIRMCECQLVFLRRGEPPRPSNPSATQAE